MYHFFLLGCLLKKTALPLQLMFSKFEYDGNLNPTFVEGAFQLPVSIIKTYIKEPVTPRFNNFLLCFPTNIYTHVLYLYFFC